MTGIVYLIGAGPGDLNLITVEGLKLLKSAEVVVYDRLASPMLLNYVSDTAKLIYVGKSPDKHTYKQEEINEILCREGQEHIVARLKGGDPFVFGRGGEEIQALKKAGIKWHTVPGVSSAVAALESAGIPVTHRGLSGSFHVFTGHSREGALDTAYSDFKGSSGSKIFLMGVSHLKEITEDLISKGTPKDTPASLVMSGTTVQEKRVTGTLANILEIAQKEGIKAPAILIVGATAELDFRCQDFPLYDLRVAVIGTGYLTEKISDRITTLGGKTISFPALKIIPYKGSYDFTSELEKGTLLVFTSANGVKEFFKELARRNLDIRKLAGKKIAAVGSGTGKVLKEYGIFPNYIPESFTVKALATGLLDKISKEKDYPVLFRARTGSPVINEIWTEAGINFCDYPLYETLENLSVFEPLSEVSSVLDYVIFNSSSGVKAFYNYYQEKQELGELFEGKALFLVIGEETRKTLQKFFPNLPSNKIITAQEYSVDGIIETLKKQKREGI